MYQKVSTNLNFVDREKETKKFWEENDIFRKSMENRKEGPTYTFYDGPPNNCLTNFLHFLSPAQKLLHQIHCFPDGFLGKIAIDYFFL